MMTGMWNLLVPGLAMSGCLLMAGCEFLHPEGLDAPPPSTVAMAAHEKEVLLQAELSPTSEELGQPGCVLPPPSFSAASVLEVEALIGEVLARNPTLPQMIAAWQAASARYPQVTSLDDPIFGTTVAPASIGSSSVDFGYRLEISQKYPFPGKLRLRGDNAQAEANAAGNEVEDTRLQLIESTKVAFYDYYLVHRAITVNEESLRLLTEFRKNAETRYKAGQVEQQDVLQADVEIGRQRERGLLLERLRQVAIARLNTLMHLPPDLPLPAAPSVVTVEERLPGPQELRTVALSRRPDLQAIRNRIAAEEASLGLAQREYYPDFEAMAAYDSIMGNGPMRDLAPQLAVRINLPVRCARRAGAVSEAEARISQRQAELTKMNDQVNYDVQQMYAQVVESLKVVQLYEKEVLPAADSNVKAAQKSYTAGRIPFLSLIEAQRNLVGLQDRHYEAIADYHRRLASLERATGGPLTPWPPAVQNCPR
jgi:outer membrane protein TolC